MADKDVKEPAGDGSSERRRYWRPTEKNTVPLAAMGALALILIIGGVVCSSGKKKKGSGEQGARSLVVAGDRARTVVVPACGTGVKITAANAAEQIDTPGSTAFALPPGGGTRAVVIPRCSSTGGSESASGGPSAAYVLPTGEAKVYGVVPPPARSKLIVPSGSSAVTVVVPPCTKKQPAEKTVVLTPKGSESTSAVAPAC